ncbi:MAG: hypothetical protein Q9228_007316 [Teloschistes exilis]
MAHDNPPPAQQQQQQTLNIPSLIFVLLILAFSIHYFFFSSASTSASSTSSNPSSQRRNRNAADPAQIEQIASMFPQLSRRDIQWDLQRNGGSVQATTERVLSGRGLERGAIDVVVEIRTSGPHHAVQARVTYLTIIIFGAATAAAGGVRGAGVEAE